MSLTEEQRARTASELRANLAASGLSEQQVADALGVQPAELIETLDASPVGDPAAVWQLRDFLAQVLADRGVEGVPFTVLTDASRRKAAGWFRLRPVPPTPQ